MHCRFCKTTLNHTILDLQHAPCSNDFLTFDQLYLQETTYPLKLFLCTNCYLVQLKEFKKARNIFNSDYIYHSSYSKTWLDHSKEFSIDSIKRFNLNTSSFVFEIASNDGYLLTNYLDNHIPCVGIEPASEIAKIAVQKKVPTINTYFNYNFAKEYLLNNKKADLIIANNVIAHVPNLNNFIKGIKCILNTNGVVSIEFPHLLNLINENQFDTIYHEHFSYFSLLTIQNILLKHKLVIFDVFELNTHGGSLRIFAKHYDSQSHQISVNVDKILNKELEFGINKKKFYFQFSKNVQNIKYTFLQYIIQKKLENNKIIAFGAAAKGNTFLNYCGIRNDLIDYVVDETPYKQGKYLPQSHIKVVPISWITKDRPDVIIIMPWNFKDEILDKLKFTKEWNCQLVTYIPSLKFY